jgi:hypothetical protein
MLVDFIIPTHYRLNELRLMLSSLKAQICGDWIATVVIDNTKNEDIENVILSFCDERIRHIYTDKTYNDWGHTPRQLGKQISQCKYVVMTGDDNYYTPNFVCEIQKTCIAHQYPEMIYFDMIHSHYEYSFFKCSLGMNQIDMGAFATRTDIAKSIELSKTYAADGFFIEDFKKAYPKATAVKIDKVLFVHN